jgi:hypothetical protein
VRLNSQPKDAIQQTRRAQQPNVARVQRRDRPSTTYLFPGHQEGLDLLSHRRRRHQVLDRMERQTAVDERRRLDGGTLYGIDAPKGIDAECLRV